MRGADKVRRAFVTSTALVLAALMSVACSITPAQREAIERTWAEREQERARECAQRGGCGQSAP